MKVKLFITNRQEETPSPQSNSFQQLDLFEDENIFYENKLRELDEVGAIFNDSTNTFSVPATKRNNKILKYWFEINYVKTDTFTFTSTQKTFNPQKRVEAYIEIDTIPYRFGRLQLENVETERGLPTSYSLTFYSEVISLEEVFGEDTLRDLISSNDESDYEFEWTLDNVSDLMTRFSSSVENIQGEPFLRNLMIPLIFSHEGDISYKTGDNSDISENPLDVVNFRPSYKLLNLINLIEERFQNSVKFESKFFESPEFQNLYVWLNANEELSLQPFNLGILEEPTNDSLIVNVTGQPLVETDNFNDFNTASFLHNYDNNTGILESNYNIQDINNIVNPSQTINTLINRIRVNLGTTPFNYTPKGVIEIFNVDNGFVYDRLEADGTFQQLTTSITVNYKYNINSTSNQNINQKIGFRYITNISETEIDGARITVDTYINSPSSGNFIERSVIGLIPTFLSFKNTSTLQSNFSIKNNLPDVTVLDFLKSIIKQFNLIIRPKKVEIIGGSGLNRRVTYVIDTFESYINSGNLLDLTQNLDLEKAVSERKEVDKTISFLYEENDSIFAEVQGYGNGRQVFDVDTKENKEIEFGLEIALPTRLKSGLEGEDTNLNMYILQDEEGKPTWTENLLIHYNNGVVGIDNNTLETNTIKMKYDQDTFDLEEVTLIDSSNSEFFNQVTNDMNFSSVGSNWHKSILIGKNQYDNYFKPYLDNVYDKQNRVTNFNLNLPYNLISQLDLDSTVLIQNNQYLVEDVKINLLNGETSLKVYPSITNRFLDKTEGFSDGSQPGVNSLFYGYNQGYHNSSVEFFTKSDCIIEKVNLGDGTGWVDLKTTEFNINQENIPSNQFSIVFDIEFNGSNNREMQIKITTNNDEYFLNIFQTS